MLVFIQHKAGQRFDTLLKTSIDKGYFKHSSVEGAMSLLSLFLYVTTTIVKIDAASKAIRKKEGVVVSARRLGKKQINI